jgi:alpha-beta hydrolase superfamily lysophospholipase
MKAFLRDVHHYLFNDVSRVRGQEFQVQDEIRRRFVETLKADAAANAGGPHVVLSHSMGTVIAYDCFKRVPDCPRVDALLTIGSPLGMDEIQDKMQPEYTEHDGYPSARVASAWGNVYDNLDVVAALDPSIRNDYRQNGNKVINDMRVMNDGAWRHNISEYLKRSDLRDWLRRELF